MLNLPLPHACGRWSARQCMRPGRAQTACWAHLMLMMGGAPGGGSGCGCGLTKTQFGLTLLLFTFVPEPTLLRGRDQNIQHNFDAGACAHAQLLGAARTQQARAARPHGARPMHQRAAHAATHGQAQPAHARRSALVVDHRVAVAVDHAARPRDSRQHISTVHELQCSSRTGAGAAWRELHACTDGGRAHLLLLITLLLFPGTEQVSRSAVAFSSQT